MNFCSNLGILFFDLSFDIRSFALGYFLKLFFSLFQVSPLLGMITGTLILIFVPAAKRGNAEQLGAQLKARTSWLRDMKALIRK